MSDDRSASEQAEPDSNPAGSKADSNSSSFDRVVPPDPMRPRRSDLRGKRALYSVDPEANPTPLLIVRCERCQVERGLTTAEVLRLMRPGLLNPCGRTLWARCPTCRHRTWLRMRMGPGIPWPFRPTPS